MGIMTSYASLGRIAGPPAGGLAYDINMSLPYVISGFMSTIGAIAVLLRRKKP